MEQTARRILHCLLLQFSVRFFRPTFHDSVKAILLCSRYPCSSTLDLFYALAFIGWDGIRNGARLASLGFTVSYLYENIIQEMLYTLRFP